MKIVYDSDNKYAKLVEVPEEYRRSFQNLLSYKLEGIEYTPAYKNYQKWLDMLTLDPETPRPRFCWNGITRLLSAKLEFPCGLVPTVERHCQDLMLDVEVIDQRLYQPRLFDISIDKRLAEINRTPRDYQVAAVEAMIKNRRGIIKSATGSGKSTVAIMAVAALGKRANIYVIGTDLLYTFHQECTKILPFKIGMIGDGVLDIQDVNIVSIWTVGKALGLKSGEILDDDGGSEEKYNKKQETDIIKAMRAASVHIFDECHIASCNTISKIYDIINAEHIYGMSGTPFRMDNADLQIKGILGENLIDISATYLIDRGVLARPVIKFIDVPKMRLPDTYQEAYKEYIIENDVRNDLIVKNTISVMEKGYIPLVLFNNIRHGEILAEKFAKAGVEFGLLNGKDDIVKRTDTMNLVRDGKLKCLICSRILDIGVDLPILSALVLAGSGKSYTRTLQRIGRVIRGYPGKKHTAIIDFHDQVKYFKKHAEIRKKYYQTEPGFKIISNF